MLPVDVVPRVYVSADCLLNRYLNRSMLASTRLCDNQPWSCANIITFPTNAEFCMSSHYWRNITLPTIWLMSYIGLRPTQLCLLYSVHMCSTWHRVPCPIHSYVYCTRGYGGAEGQLRANLPSTLLPYFSTYKRVKRLHDSNAPNGDCTMVWARTGGSQSTTTVAPMKSQYSKAWLHAFLAGAGLVLALFQLGMHVYFEKSTSVALSPRSRLNTCLQTSSGQRKKTFLFIGALVPSKCRIFDECQCFSVLYVHMVAF